MEKFNQRLEDIKRHIYALRYFLDLKEIVISHDDYQFLSSVKSEPPIHTNDFNHALDKRELRMFGILILKEGYENKN